MRPDWSAQQQRQQELQRQRGMQYAYEKKRREERDAQRRAEEEAARHERQGQRGAEVDSGGAAWRPNGSPAHTDKPLFEAPGFFQQLPRRLLRLLLLGIVIGCIFMLLNLRWQNEAADVLVTVMVGVIGILLIMVLRPRHHSRQTYQGVASHVMSLTGGSNTPATLTFRLERYDARGSRVAPIPVELRGERVKGQLLDGDEVEVVRGKVRGGVLRPKCIVNLRTGQTVRMSRAIGHWIVYAIVWSLLAVFLGVIIYALMR